MTKIYTLFTYGNAARHQSRAIPASIHTLSSVTVRPVAARCAAAHPAENFAETSTVTRAVTVDDMLLQNYMNYKQKFTPTLNITGMNSTYPLSLQNVMQRTITVCFLLTVLLLFSLRHSYAQATLSNYTFSTGTSGSLTADANSNTIDMSSGAVQLIQENSAASTVSAVMNLNLNVDPTAAPFKFWFMGALRTQFSVSSNGVIRLDNGTATHTFAPAANVPLIAVFSQTTTSGTSRTGYVRGKLFGTAPNRTLVIEWRNIRIPNASTTADGTFQARLYEGTGVIEMVYGMMRNTGGIAGVTYNTGIASSNTATTAGYVTVASNSFTLAASPTANPAPTTGAPITNLHSTSDGSRRTYTFTPSVTPTAPSSMTFSSVSQTAMTVNWTDNASNESGYALYRSDDGGTTYNLLSVLTYNTTTSGAQSNLIPGKTYYWKVYAVNEGGISGELSGSQATTAATTITSTTTGGNWNTPGTWAGGVVPNSGIYDVVIADGATVSINSSYTINNLTVGQGTSGTLQYNSATSYTLTVNGDVTVQSGATFSNTAGNITSNLYIGGSAGNTSRTGNLTVNGTFDMHRTSTYGTNVTFYGGQNASISGSGTIDFYLVYLNKGPLTVAAYTPAINSILEVNRGYTYQGANTLGPFSTITSGTLKINSTGNIPIFNSNPTIPAVGGFWLNNSSYNVAGSTTGQTTITNTGLLRITAGTLNVGSTNAQNISLLSNSITIIEGGTVNVSGRFGALTGVYPLYKQSSGTVSVATVGNTTASYGSFDVGPYSYSYFEMSGGSITASAASSGSPKNDIRGAMGSYKITGGSVAVGSGTTYNISGALPSFNANSKNITLYQSATIVGDYSNPGTTFTTSSNTITFNGAAPSSGTIVGTSGTVAFYGASAQTLGGTLTTPLNLIVNNAAGVTIPSTTLSTTTATLWLLNGTLSSSGTITLGGGAATATKIIKDNGSLAAAPTLNLGTGAHTEDYLYLGNSTSAVSTGYEYILSNTNTATILTINNYNGVTLDAARFAGYMNLYTGLLNTTATNLISVINTANTAVAGYSVNSYVNGPLNRALANGTATYAFPSGTASTYANLDLPVTTPGGTLSAQVEYKESATGGTAGTGLSSLIDRYWKVDKTTGTGNITNTLPVVTTSGLGSGYRLGYSATLTGAYSNISAAPVSGTLTAVAPTTITGTAPQTAYYTLANAGTLSGTISAGTSTPYPDLASVAHALRTMLVTGDVIFEFTGYTGENVPNQTVSFYPFAKSGGDWTATIRPATGQSGFVTQGDPGSGNPLINFIGIDSLTIDGRPGGTGTNREWLFRNTRTAATLAPTFQLINDATHNTLNYLNIEGQNTNASGTVYFSNSTGTLGNSDNTISYCHIRDRSDVSGLPYNGIYSLGQSAAVNNARNIISNNHIYNYFVATSSGSAAVSLGNYNAAWTISGNHIYQTAARTGTVNPNNCYGIIVNNNNGLSQYYVITDNYIGGSQANAGSTATTFSGTGNQSFTGIYFKALSTGNNLIENNVIKNISVSHGTTANALLFVGINDAEGNTEIKGNTIGGTAAGDAITINSILATASGAYGIYSTSGTDTISNNTIAGITLSNTAGIVGVTGIHLGTTTVASLIVDSNTIAKLTAAYTGATAGGFARGIVTAAGAYGTRTIKNNTIYELSSATTNTVAGASAVTAGIIQQSTTAGHLLSNNTIYNLTNTGAAATNIVGIYYTGATTGTNLVERNLIHSLKASSATAVVNGIQIAAGNTTYQNNMVRLGIDAAGADITSGNTFNGIYQAGTGTDNFWYNSVYVGGTGVTSSLATYALNSLSTSTTARSIQNNIFWNARSNGSGTAKNYAIAINNTTNLTSGYNDLYATGTGGVLGSINSVDKTLFTDFGTNNFGADPKFINATGNASAVNLHIRTDVGTPVEGVGLYVAAVLKDYDDSTRSTGTAPNGPDVGADEGTFIAIDLIAPSVSISTPASHTCNTSSTATLSATITDASGIAVKTGDRPRAYYKKTSNTNAFNDNTSSTDGWKWVEATNLTSPFSFSLDLTKLNGGYKAGEAVQYFVVAQDSGANVPPTPNVGVSPVTFAATPSGVALTSGAFPVTGTPQVFAILPCEGTVTVGSGSSDNYKTFTVSGNLTDGTAGIFQAINAATLTGQLKVEVTTDISTETGAVALNQNAGAYNIQVIPDGTTLRSISGSATTALFKMDGADIVRFSGGSGTDRYLKFTNTATNGATFQFINDATTDTLNNLIVEGSSNSVSSGVIFISTTTGTTGNDNIRIENCDIKEAGSNYPANGIFALGTSAKTNDNIVVKGCNIYNYFLPAATTAHGGVYASSYNSSWTIENNKLFQTASRTYTAAAAPISAIYVGNSTGQGGGFTVKGNTIGYSSASATGTMTYTSTAAIQYAGIVMNVLASPVSEVSNNTIRNISFTSISAGTANWGLFSGIHIYTGGVNVLNNTIGAATGTGAISVALNTNSGGNVNGIKNDAAGPVKIYNNTIGSINATGAGTNVGVNLFGIYSTTGNVAARGNNIGSATTPNSIKSDGTATSNIVNVAGIKLVYTTTSDSVLNNNIYNLAIGNASGTASYIRGIDVSGTSGVFHIENNDLSKLTNGSVTTGTTSSAAVIGIVNTATGTPLTITRNKVYSLTTTASSAAMTMTGIYTSGPTTGTNNITKNFVHSLSHLNTTGNAVITGIHVYAGLYNVANNMVRLGIDAGGSNITRNYTVRGIWHTPITNNTAYYYNTVYVGGSGVGSGSNKTYGFYREGTSGTIYIKNNIFYNNRANGAGTGNHFAIGIANMTGIVAANVNYNHLYSNNGTIGEEVSTVRNTIGDWRTASGTPDMNSITGLLNFVDATGDTNDVDLHIDTTIATPIESAGITGVGTWGDYDNEIRFGESGYSGSGTAPDIGADEYNFTPLDINPPAISISTPPSDVCNTATTVTMSATITDASSVALQAGKKPRAYYKNVSDANTYDDNTSGTDGWKWVEATNATSPFSFTLDLTKIYNGIKAGTAIQYFVVAQDSGANVPPTPNVGISTGSFAATPSSVALTSAAFPISGTPPTISVLPCEGTVTVGTGGNYEGFTPNGGLFQAINATSALGGLTNNLTVNVVSDVAVENGLNALNQWTGAYTVTIKPSSNTLRTISNVGNITGVTAMIPINGADGLIINGKYNGSGQYLRFRNTHTTASSALPTLAFYGGSTNDSLVNCYMEGNLTGTATAVLLFGTGTNTNINIIGNNFTSPSGGTVNNPANHIYSNNTNNSSIFIQGNDFNNFNTSGILLTSGATWTIGGNAAADGNNFYQTSSIATAHTVISVGVGSHTVKYNRIGGNATPVSYVIQGTWTNSGSVAVKAIEFSSVSSGTISNNTIQNFSLTNTSAPSFTGISLASSGATTVSSNTIQNISIPGATSTASITAISNTGSGAATIQTNTIGGSGKTLSNSGSGAVKGIFSSSTNTSTLIGGSSSGLGNTVSYLVTSHASSQINGIHISGAASGVQYNTIYALSHSGSNTGTGASASVIGILQAGSNAHSTANNDIYGLSSSANAAVVTAGIVVNSAVVHTLSSNFIHNFASSSTTSVQQGINLAAMAANTVVKNNMIALGVDGSGSAITNSVSIAGITKASTNAANIFHNSVYIGGSGITGGTVNTFAFQRTGNASDDIRNNLFVNARAGSGSALHYAFVLNSTTIGTCDYNIYYAPTGNNIASVNGGTTALTTYQSVRYALSGQNSHSGVGNPAFNSPAAGTANLHLTNGTPAEGTGVAIGSVTDDYDGQTRSGLSPTDIGADADDFGSPSSDIFYPAVSVTAIPNQSACSGTLNISVTATVTDIGSGVATGSLAPTLWWKLGTGAGVPGDWTAVTPSSNSGNDYYYTLTLTGVTSGQTYQYYVAAQDQASTPNIWYSHYNATTPVHSDVSTITTTNGGAASFTILSITPLSGPVTVGSSGADYTSLTNAGGLFAAINTNGLNGDLIVTVISNISETGTNALNQWTDYCGGPYSILIQPDGTTTRVLSGSVSSSLITFNGADRVTVDGNYSGSGRYLQFKNTNSLTGNVFTLTNDATNITIRNCDIQGLPSNTASGVIAITTGASTGNKDIAITGNLIHDAGSGYPLQLIYSNGSASYPNNNITISNNEIYNWSSFGGGTGARRAYGINVTSTGNGSNWKINGNSFYNTFIDGTGMQTAINFTPGSSSVNDSISNNWIGGKAANGGADNTPWQNSWDNYFSGENQVQGIYVNCGTIALDGNNITNIYVSNSDYSGFVGMYFGGSTVPTVTNNVFGTGSSGQPSSGKMIQVAGGGVSGGYYPGYIYGIWNASTSTSMATYTGNYFYYLFQSGAYEGGNVHCISHQTKGPATITNNVINGPQASGRNWNSFGIRLEPTASTSGNLIEHNTIAGPYINSLVVGGVVNSAIYVNVLSTYTVSGTINRNVVWDMRSADRAGATEGIYVFSSTGGNGNWDIINNMVTLKNNGSTSNCIGLYGIETDLNSSSTVNVKYNTIYIGGANGGTPYSTTDYSSYAFFRFPNQSGTVSGGTINLQNNIFINSRTVGNSYTTGHFAIGNYGTSNYATGWNTSDYNFLFTNNGTYNYIGIWGTTKRDYQGGTITQWQSSSGKDANSYTATVTTGSSNFSTGYLNPDVDGKLFVNTLSDLHISNTDGQSYMFVDNRATPISVTTDYDGQNRNGSTPDIGADEFGTRNDAGVIAIKPNCNGTSVDVTIKNFGSAVLTSFKVDWSINGTGQPQQTYTSQSVASGATVVKTIALNTPSSFTAATAYNVVAYTTLPNGVADENSSNDSYTANPLYYGMGSTVYVGTTGSPKFSTYNELFNAINNSVLTGDLSVVVNASTTEPSTPTFLNDVGYCGSVRTITITPASATVYTAVGSSGNMDSPGMIGFHGASNVTIDGNYSGSGQYLRFRNNSGTYPTFTFRNDADTITVKNSVIEGNNSNTYVSGGIINVPGVIFFGDAKTASGNSNIAITNNTIRSRSDATGIPANMIFSYNNTGSTTNNTNTISGNDIFNFSQNGVYLPDNAGNGNNWTITGNNFYCTTDLSSYQGSVPQQIAIYIKASSSKGHKIKNNVIGGSASGGSGTWTNSNNYLDFEGIRLEIGGSTAADTTVVSGNTIKNISLTGINLSNFIGIRVKTGWVDIIGNTIGDLSATISSPSILVAGSGTNDGSNNNVYVFGIWNYSTNPSTISNNLVAGIKSTAPYNTNSGYAFTTGIRRGAKEYGTNAQDIYAGKSIIKGNTVANLWSESSLSNVFLNLQWVDKVWPAALSGIALRSNYGSDNRVDSNTVYGLAATSTWNRWVRVHGISLNAETSSDAGLVTKNRIYDLVNYNGGVFGANVFTPAISGIALGASDLTTGNAYIANGSYTLVNNMIYLAPDVHPTKQYNNPDIYGILDVTKSGNTTKFYYNTVYISGEGKTSLPGDCPVVPSYGYMRSAAGNGESDGGTVYMKNNIIINNRTGYVKNFALCNNASTPATGWSGSNINYNFLSTGDTNTVGQKIVGNFQSGPATDYTFTNWKSAFSTDANSKYGKTVTGSTSSTYTDNPFTDVVNPGAGYLFMDPDDIVTSGEFLHLDNSSDDGYLFAEGNGVDLSSLGFTTDIDGTTRDASTPYIGAHELDVCLSPNVTVQPSNMAECVGGNVTFSLTATGQAPLQYQWSDNHGSGWNTISGATNSSVTVTSITAGMNGYQYRCEVTNACGSTTSSSAVLTVNLPPVIDTSFYSPVTFVNTICSGSSTWFEVTANGPGKTFQWKYYNGSSWVNVSNGTPTGVTYTPTVTVDTATLNISTNSGSTPPGTYLYRCEVTNSCGADTTITGTLNYYVNPAVSTHPSNASVCITGSAGFSITATGGGILYNWEYYNGVTWGQVADGTPVGVTYSGGYTTSMTVTTTGSTPSGTYQYRCNAHNLCNPSGVNSNTATLTVNNLPVVSPQPLSTQTVCQNNTPSNLTIGITGGAGTLTYQWYDNGTTNSINGGTSISGATNDTYTPPTSAVGTIYYYVKATSSGSGCGDTSSNTAAVIVVTGSPGYWIGGYDTNWSDSRNWCGGVPDSTVNVVIPDVSLTTGNFPVISDSAYSHNLNIEDGASLTINSASGNLALYGDLSLDPTAVYSHTNGKIVFSGSTSQTVATITAYDVVVKNSGGVTLDGNLTVSNQLTLANGVITTGSDTVIVTDTAANSIVAALTNVGTNYTVSYIHGNLTRHFRDSSTLTYDFPVGTASKGRLASVKSNYLTGKSVNNPYGIRKFTAFFKDGPMNTGGFQADQYLAAWETTFPGNPYHTPYVRIRDEGSWIIEPDSAASDGKYDISLYFNGFNSPQLTDNQFGILKRPVGSTTFADFKPAGGIVNVTNGAGRLRTDGYALRKNLKSFSEFAIGESDAVLPVQLTTFTAEKCNNDLDALLKWNTASELHNDHFDVELGLRMDANGEMSFTKIGEVKGFGTSTIEHNYNFTDVQPNKAGNRYYRLKQVDTDGSYAYSEIRVLNFNTTKVEISTLYPNPTGDILNFVISTPHDKDVIISVTNLIGQEVFSSKEGLMKGVSTLRFDVSRLAQGVYFLNVKDEGGVTIHKKFEKF